MNLASALDARVIAGPDRIALHAEGRTLTRSQLRDAIVRAAARLRKGSGAQGGVRAGDRVAYLGANRSEEIVLLFALARIGAVFVPLNTRLAVPELAAIVAHAQLRALATDSEHREVGIAALALARSGTQRQAQSGARTEVQQRQARVYAIDDLLAADGTTSADIDDIEAVGPDAALLLAYTSGTTGAPKGALHTHRGMLANVRASIAAHDLSEDDRVLTVLPLFHVGGLCIQTLPALLAGATVILQPRFDAGAWLAAIVALRPTLTLMVPATLRAAIAHPAWPATDLSCLRAIMAGSSTIPRALIDAVHARDVPLGQIYGATETGPVSVALRACDARDRPGFAGWPCFEQSVRIVAGAGGDGDVDVPGNAVGEVLVRAPNVMKGYWREPDAEGFRDGWFATGDLARRDADGCIEVVGRSRDLIISGGENVYPAELEDVLLAIDGVLEAAVVGVPDERWGEVPAAFVVRANITSNATSNAADAAMLDEAAIAAAFDHRLARFKHPKRIVFVDRLPRNAMGKVQAHRLRERLVAADAKA